MRYMLEQYQKQEGFLQSVHPLLKLSALLLVIFLMITILDPWTPLLVYIWTVIILILLGKIPLKIVLLVSMPFFLFGLTFIWIYAVFPADRGETILFYLFHLPIAKEDVMNGIALGLRSVVFGTWSILFVFTTNPTYLLLGMIQQGKLPPKFGYGMMAAYRLLPSFKSELEQLRLAYRLRGVKEKKSLKGAIAQMRRYSIPMLASSIRKAHRTAIAMESKGFTGEKERTYYTQITWSWQDVTFTLLLLSSILCIAFIRLHYFI